MLQNGQPAIPCAKSWLKFALIHETLDPSPPRHERMRRRPDASGLEPSLLSYGWLSETRSRIVVREKQQNGPQHPKLPVDCSPLRAALVTLSGFGVSLSPAVSLGKLRELYVLSCNVQPGGPSELDPAGPRTAWDAARELLSCTGCRCGSGVLSFHWG